VPMSTISAPPIAMPTAVPARERSTVDPVASAFERSTERVPSTTQNPCCSSARWPTSTASERAAAPRTLLRNHTASGVA
jgi:hypothetical protein